MIFNQPFGAQPTRHESSTARIEEPPKYAIHIAPHVGNKNGTTRAYIRTRTYKYDGNDQRKRVSVYGRTRHEVEAKLRDIAQRRIASFRAQTESLGTLVARWLERARPDHAARTHELYKMLFENHIRPHIGTIQLGRLKPAEVLRLLRESLADVGSRTRQLVYRILHMSLEEAVEDGLIASNPCLTKFKPRHRYKEFRSLSLEEVHKLLETAKQGKHFLIIYLALATGMRQGELFALRGDAVDIEHRCLAVVGTLTTDSDRRPIVGKPKGGRSRRIDLSP